MRVSLSTTTKSFVAVIEIPDSIGVPEVIEWKDRVFIRFDYAVPAYRETTYFNAVETPAITEVK